MSFRRRAAGFACVSALALIGVGSPVLLETAEAHHSHASIDPNKPVEMSGFVKEYQWRAPHVYFVITSQTDSGEMVDYSIEALNPPAMAALGWGPETLKAGEAVTWAGHHDRDPDRPYASMDWLDRADGTRLYSSIAMSRQRGEGAQLDTTGVPPATEIGEGLWHRISADGSPFPPQRLPPADWPLTEIGQARVAAFSEDDNPIAKCIEGGPPRLITSLLGFQWTRPDENTILIDRDLLSAPRVIHLDPSAPRGEPSSAGHSIGRFEGDVLVIETDNFVAETWGLAIGIDSSDQKSIVERYSLSPDGKRLNVEVTVTDPVMLTQPHTFTHQWVKIRDRPLIKAPCSLENAQAYLTAGYEDSSEAADGSSPPWGLLGFLAAAFLAGITWLVRRNKQDDQAE
jgi:hypothetical protein